MLGWPWGVPLVLPFKKELVIQWQEEQFADSVQLLCLQNTPQLSSQSHVLARQAWALTEHGGGSQPGHFYPVRGFTIGSLCSGTPTDVSVKTSSDLHHGLRHSQLDSASFHLFSHKCQISIPAQHCSLSLYVSQVITLLLTHSLLTPSECLLPVGPKLLPIPTMDMAT